MQALNSGSHKCEDNLDFTATWKVLGKKIISALERLIIANDPRRDMNGDY